MIKSEETTINGARVIATQLPGRRAFNLKIRILKLITPALGKLIGGVDTSAIREKVKSAMDSKVDSDSLSTGIALLADSINPDALFSMMLEACASTQMECNGKLIAISENTFDMLFSGDLVVFYQVVWFALKVNYSDFFAMGSTLLHKVETDQNLSRLSEE